ncbi:MAG TPA: hypothetical protein PLY68_05865 [Myxococcota bacterium]|nr:hypothetical protein [Myxococcota bacterium]HQP95707.1 hypothetical protein [Myxococcota bacterium]
MKPVDHMWLLFAASCLVAVPALPPMAYSQSDEPGDGTAQVSSSLSEVSVVPEPADDPKPADPADDVVVSVDEPVADDSDLEEPDQSDESDQEDPEQNIVKREAKKIKSFEGAYLMVGRNVKVPTQTRKFALGIDLDVAPLNIVASRTRDVIVDEAVNQICQQTPNPELCSTQVEGSVEQVLDILGDVTPEQWDMIRAAAGGDPGALDQVLEEVGVSDPAARGQVVDFIGEYAGEAGTAEQRMQAVDAVRTVSSSSAISLILEPYLYMNFKWIEVVLSTPFALQIMDEGGTEVEMANISVNLKSGGDWSVGSIVSFGFSGGIELYLPSGTSGIGRSMNSDIFSAPKFAYGYLTWAPYLVLGMDLARFFQLQTHVELISMHDVLDTAAIDTMMFLKYGAGFIIMPKFVVSVLFEMNGLRGIMNSDRFDTFMVATGLNIRVAFFKMYLGVQIPLLDQGRYVWDSGYWTAANYDQLSKFTVMTRIGFEF